MNFAQTFKALSNPIRRSILELLKAGKLSAGDIAGHFDVAGATISHHLSILKQADLIREEKEKNFIYYELNTSVLEDLMVWLVDLKADSTDENESKTIAINFYGDPFPHALGADDLVAIT